MRSKYLSKARAIWFVQRTFCFANGKIFKFIILKGITPFIAIKMSSFDLLRTYYLPQRSHPRFDTINLTLGAIAG